jgi:hypothetical protein
MRRWASKSLPGLLSERKEDFMDSDKLGKVCEAVEQQLAGLSRKDRMFVFLVMTTTYLREDGIDKKTALDVVTTAVEQAYGNMA